MKDDTVSRASVLKAIDEYERLSMVSQTVRNMTSLREIVQWLPAAQPDYKEVLGWLLAYHTMSFDLHGRYLPHEVISWLINDFTKEFIAGREQDE